jgi:predicted exporter
MSRGASRLRAWAVVLWLAAVVAALALAWRAHYVADLSAFLPASPTAEQAVLLAQLKSSPASRLVLIGRSGAPPGNSEEAAAAARAAIEPRRHRAARASGVFVGAERRDRQPADAGRFGSSTATS